MAVKISIIIFIFALLLVPPFFENSFAQTSDLQKKPTSKIFMEMRLYDKDGHLYGYIQPVVQIFDMERTIEWVAPHATNSSVVYQGQRYLLMKFEDASGHGGPLEQLGGYFLNVPINGQDTNIFYAWNDSFLMNKGDIQKVYWEVLIPSM